MEKLFLSLLQSIDGSLRDCSAAEWLAARSKSMHHYLINRNS